MRFEFQDVANFTRIDIFTANHKGLSIKVFKLAKVWFSVGGQHFNSPPLSFEPESGDGLRWSLKNISIPVQGRVGKYVKIQLFFNDIWILISEIEFATTQVQGQVQVEDPSKMVSTTAMDVVTSSAPTTFGNMEVIEADENVFMEVLIGVLAAVTFLLLFFFIMILIYSKRQKLLQSPASRYS